MISIKKPHQQQKRAKVGGAAGARGYSYQARVTAHWMLQMLLAKQQEEYGFTGEKVVEVSAETPDDVDDVKVMLEHDQTLYGQCKNTLDFSKEATSTFGKTLEQLFRQFTKTTGKVSLVVFYQNASKKTTALKTLLDRYRSKKTLTDAAITKDEKVVADELEALLASLQKVAGCEDIQKNQKQFLNAVSLKPLQMETGDGDYEASKTLLRTILDKPSSDKSAINNLFSIAQELGIKQESIDAEGLTSKLKACGLKLKDNPDFEDDFDILDTLSKDQLASFEANYRDKIVIGTKKIAIKRKITDDVLKIADASSFLVTGDAGSGKSGVDYQIAKFLAKKKRVWFWAASSFNQDSIQGIRSAIGLRHTWSDIFAAAAAGKETTIIIDGLDALRDAKALDAQKEIISLAIQNGVKVIASIRAFDLKYSFLGQTFRNHTGLPLLPAYQNPQFGTCLHIHVPVLSESELDQVIKKIPLLNKALNDFPRLRPVVSNLFSLQLLCELIEDGGDLKELSTITTQSELFSKFWEKRVHEFETRGGDRKNLETELLGFIETLVNEQKLVAKFTGFSTPSRKHLLSTSTLRNPELKGRVPDENIFTFAHDLLFDYLAERLFVRPKRAVLKTELQPYDSWGLFLRPSLLLFYRWAWQEGRDELWEILLSLEGGGIPTLQRFPGYVVVAEEAKLTKDFEPVVEGITKDKKNEEAWKALLGGIVNTAIFVSLPKLLENGSGLWWLELADRLIRSGDRNAVHRGSNILHEVFKHLSKLPEHFKKLFNEATIELIKFHWGTPTPYNYISAPIKLLCHSFASNPANAEVIIRKMIDKAELPVSGYIQAQEVASCVEHIWDASPQLAVDIYDALFSYEETDESTTGFNQSVILSLTSNRRQDYNMAHHSLQNSYPKFLQKHPAFATAALVRVVEHYRDYRTTKRELPPGQNFKWRTKETGIQTDYSHIWDRDDTHREENSMLLEWQRFLISEVAKKNLVQEWQAIADILCRPEMPAALWRRLLTAALAAPKFFFKDVSELICKPEVLACCDLEFLIAGCVKKFIPLAGDTFIKSFESAVHSLLPEHCINIRDERRAEYVVRLKAKYLSLLPQPSREPKSNELIRPFEDEDMEIEDNSYRSQVTSRHVTAEEWLEHDGVKIKKDEHRELLRETTELDEMKIANMKLEAPEAIQRLMDKLQIQKEKLQTYKSEMDPKLFERIYDNIIYAYSIIARSDVSIPEKLKQIMIDAFVIEIEHLLANQEVKSAEVDKIEDISHWGTTDTRVTAVGGLMRIIYRDKNVTDEQKKLLKRIAAADDPMIAFSLADYIWAFLEYWPEFTWETIENWLANLPKRKRSYRLLRTAFRNGSWFWFLHSKDDKRADKFFQQLLKIAKSMDLTEMLEQCGDWLMLFSLNEVKWANDELKNASEAMDENIHVVYGAFMSAMRRVFERMAGPRKKIEPAEQKKAKALLLKMLKDGNKHLDAYVAQVKALPQDKRPKEPPKYVNTISRLFDILAGEFQMLAQKKVGIWKAAGGPTKVELKEWWEEVSPYLEELCYMAHPAIAYDVIRGLEHLATIDMKNTLHWLATLTLASKAQGITYEHMAADKTVDVLQAVFADHKKLLAEDPESRKKFLQALDAYLDIGWPSAIRMAIQIDGMFR